MRDSGEKWLLTAQQETATNQKGRQRLSQREAGAGTEKGHWVKGTNEHGLWEETRKCQESGVWVVVSSCRWGI